MFSELAVDFGTCVQETGFSKWKVPWKLAKSLLTISKLPIHLVRFATSVRCLHATCCPIPTRFCTHHLNIREPPRPWTLYHAPPWTLPVQMRDLLKVFQRVVSSKAGALPRRIQQGVAPLHEEADDWHSPKKQIPHSELPQEMLEMLNHMEKTGQVAKRVPKVAMQDKDEDADDGDGAGDARRMTTTTRRRRKRTALRRPTATTRMLIWVKMTTVSQLTLKWRRASDAPGFLKQAHTPRCVERSKVAHQ